jgi:transcriptional regulator with XRE-family HTH domain
MPGEKDPVVMMTVAAAMANSRDTIRRQELGRFLRTRRARISPADVELHVGLRRRHTPSLRREEVAALADLSTTWYTWLEQGRDIRISAQALERIAGVLKLDRTERAHLFQLALRQPTLSQRFSKDKVSAVIQRTLNHIPFSPSLILNRCWDVLAWNLAACAFFINFEDMPATERNLVWLAFTHSKWRTLFVDWPNRARDLLARLRFDYGRYPGEPQFLQLVERLKRASREFAEWWPRQHHLIPQTEGQEHYNHPAVGPLILEHAFFTVNKNPNLQMLILTPTAEMESIAKLYKAIEIFRMAQNSGNVRSAGEIE